jgi:hypothetical protein
MLYFRYKWIRKVCALVIAIFIFPVLAYVEHENRKDGNATGDDGGTNDREEKHPPVVPEVNAAWVLAPFFGAVLLFSARRYSPVKTSRCHAPDAAPTCENQGSGKASSRTSSEVIDLKALVSPA